MDQIESKYLEFNVIEKKPKTSVIAVYSKRSDIILGTIEWFGRWRQYAFFPQTGTAFNSECLDDIGTYIKNLMLERKNKQIENKS